MIELIKSGVVYPISRVTLGTNLTVSEGTDGLPTIAASLTGSTALDDLTDVVITSPTTGHVLRHNGTNFVNVLLDASHVGAGTFTGAFTFSGTQVSFSAAPIAITGTAASQRDFRFQTSGTNRWIFRVMDTEPGSNVGANLYVMAIDDAGTLIDYPITVGRQSTGLISLNRTVNLTGKLTHVTSGTFNSEGTAPIYIRHSTANGVAGLILGADNTNTLSYIQAVSTGTTYNYRLALNPNSGAVTIGTDPGSSDLFRVGGAVRINGVLTGLSTVTAPIYRSTSDANVDGTNIQVTTTTKSSALFALEVVRSGSPVATITVIGGATFASIVTEGVLSVGTTVATVGQIRLGNNQSIVARNAANTDNVGLIGLTTSNNVSIGNAAANEVQLTTSSGQVLRMNASGHFLFNTTNSTDIGASGSGRPRSIYVGTDVIIGTDPGGTHALRVGGNLRVGGQGFVDRHNLGTTSGTVNIDWNNGNGQRIRSNGNMTFTFANGVAGGTYVVEISYGGAHTVTWPASVKWAAATAPAATSVLDKKDVFVFYFDGTDYLGGLFGNNYSSTT